MSTTHENQTFLDAERFLVYEKSVTDSRRLNEVLKLIDRSGIKILDVGGASGLFLSELSKRSNCAIEMYNLDTDTYFQTRQTDPSIHFINGSIIHTDLPNNSFDIVTFGDVLHHLIGKNLRDTDKNQLRALQEMIRIIKPGGYVVFNEEVNNIRVFSIIIYYLSRLAARLKLSFPFFDAGKVVVRFPTQQEVTTIIEKVGVVYSTIVIKKHFERWEMLLRWKLTLLMSNVGHIHYVIQKSPIDTRNEK